MLRPIMGTEAGHQILHYRIVEKIGEGGMGEVWKASPSALASIPPP